MLIGQIILKQWHTYKGPSILYPPGIITIRYQFPQLIKFAHFFLLQNMLDAQYCK